MSKRLSDYLKTPALQEIERVCGETFDALDQTQKDALLHCISFALLTTTTPINEFDDQTLTLLPPDLDSVLDALRESELRAVAACLTANQ